MEGEEKSAIHGVLETAGEKGEGPLKEKRAVSCDVSPVVGPIFGEGGKSLSF